MAYDHLEIEARWQRYWDEHGTFRATRRSGRPKRYVLDMFPYPSGVGLHVGHPEGYTATDIMARAWRMRGYDVLHPMGWDAFGLPAEQHAIETGQHPAGTTANNIATFKRQLKMLGFSYDWSREIDTTDPGYVRWTQWIFLQLFRRGLAYQATVPVNWCPALGTVLANEEVVDGKSERGGHPVYRTPIRQWMLKITAYADRLAEDLALVDWPEGTLTAQRRWIGRSEGAEIVFGVDGHPDARIAVFTTRPDTLMGATYVVLAPEHELTRTLATPARREAVVAYVEAAARKSELDRVALAKTKTGVPTGAVARTRPARSRASATGASSNATVAGSHARPTPCRNGRARAGTTCGFSTRTTTTSPGRWTRTTRGCPSTSTSAAPSTRCSTSSTPASGTRCSSISVTSGTPSRS